MARVLWTGMHQLGGLFATAPIGLELVARGHEVVALSTPDARPALADLGFGFRAHRRLAPYDWTRPDAVPVRLDDLSAENYRRLLIDPIPDQMADVGELLDSEPFDLVVSDCTLYGAGLAAEQAALAWVCLVAFAFDESITFPDGRYRAGWDAMRARLGLGPDPRPAEDPWLCFSPHLTLLLGLPELAFRRSELPAYVQRPGPVLWDPATDFEPPEWFHDLGRHRPMVLLALSSAWVDEAELVVKVAEGLGGEDLDVVVTVPARHELPPMPPNVRVTSYFPHRLLVPRAAAVVCSGSYGVTTRAVCAGVPVLAVPYGGDGNCVALAVARAGVGIALDPAKATAGGIRGAVHRLLSDPRYRQQAGRLAQAATRYRAVPAAADAIEGVLARARPSVRAD